MRALYEGPRTLRELRGVTGLAESTIRGYVKALRSQKLVRVCDILRNTNNTPCIHVYEWAPDEPDYRIPAKQKLTGTQRSKLYRQRRRLHRLQTALTAGNAPLVASPTPEAAYCEGDTETLSVE